MLEKESWFFNLSLKMQTTINQIHVPNIYYENIELVCKWIKNNITSNNSEIELPFWSQLQNELNYCPLHFIIHFIDVLAIISYYHPNLNTRKIAFDYYTLIVEKMMHLNIEYKQDLGKRL